MRSPVCKRRRREDCSRSVPRPSSWQESRTHGRDSTLLRWRPATRSDAGRAAASLPDRLPACPAGIGSRWGGRRGRDRRLGTRRLGRARTEIGLECKDEGVGGQRIKRKAATSCRDARARGASWRRATAGEGHHGPDRRLPASCRCRCRPSVRPERSSLGAERASACRWR